MSASVSPTSERPWFTQPFALLGTLCVVCALLRLRIPNRSEQEASSKEDFKSLAI